MFLLAKPVWAKGLQEQKHINLGLYTKFLKPENQAVIKIAVSGYYRIFVNGKFVNYGPVRCAKNYFRVDEINLMPYLENGENHIAIETVNYAIPNFAAVKQAGFIQAELETDGKVIAFTDEKNCDFDSYLLKSRIRKTQIYSFQRTLTEGYRLNSNYNMWYIGRDCEDVEAVVLQETGKKSFLERGIPFSKFQKINLQKSIARGNVKINPEKDGNDFLFFNGRDGFTDVRGFETSELEVKISDDIVKMEFEKTDKTEIDSLSEIKLLSEKFNLTNLPTERTGFVSMDIECSKKTKLYMIFDEILDDNKMIDPFRMICVNAIYLELEVGKYHFMNMEPVGFKYINFINIGGEVTVKNFALVEYANPYDKIVEINTDDNNEKMIFDAAWQTFRQNASDIFMDCPTRERAGWLCDSFFTGRAEQFFTGQSLMEKQFLENFIIAPSSEHLPSGMLDMCYPSDHYNGTYIISWAMWYVAELYDYTKRTGDQEVKKSAKQLVYNLLEFLKGQENSDGLLEKLPGWVFVEWSKANDLVQDINYPTNMLYSYILRKIGEMYDDSKAMCKGENLKQLILKRSFNGEFFVDNEVYRGNKSVLTGETSETCQYHAFFFDIATPESHSELWNKLITEFGPDREKKGIYPNVYPSNAFTGNYLRLNCLLRYGLYDKLRSEITGYFTDMAEKTGTLWENMSAKASCNHGFASYAAFLLYNAVEHKTPEFVK